MKKRLLFTVLAYFVTCSTALTQQAIMPKFSTQALEGKVVYQQNCVECHGKDVLGTDLGPPLLHPFYRPDHHGDDAIKRAIKKGVMPHHWLFGAMPAIETIKDEDIPKLISFIRELQRANGIK